MPKFMMLISDDEEAREALPVEEQIANLRAKGEWFARQAGAGHNIEGHRLAPKRTARTVRTGRNPRASDGPFLETKEWIGGYAVMELPDMDAAVELALTFPGFDAVIEIRAVEDGPQAMAALEGRAAAR